MSHTSFGSRLAARMSELKSKNWIPDATNAYRLWNDPNGGWIEAYGKHLWIVVTTEPPKEGFLSEIQPWAAERESFQAWMTEAGFESASILFRGSQGTVPQSGAGPHPWIGQPPREAFWVSEQGIEFEVNVSKGVQSGLFLDQALTRKWVAENAERLRVLNLFAYTGSLSIAAAVGGASEVWTLDLARPAIESARRGFERNGFPAEGAHKFWVGDAFDWMPQWQKKGVRFDMVIVDPPAFARSPKGPDKGVFRVEKHWAQLMESCWRLLNPGGLLVASHNVHSLSQPWTIDGVEEGADSANLPRPQCVQPIEMPQTFDSSYLKGGIFQMGQFVH